MGRFSLFRSGNASTDAGGRAALGRCPRPGLTQPFVENRRGGSLSGREIARSIANPAGTSPASCPSTLRNTPAHRPATTTMQLPDLQFRKLGETAGILLLRTALVLALAFALVNAFQG